MLNGTLTLHDIHDVEAFTAKLLPPPPDEDLHAHLIALTWELSTTYRPGRTDLPPNFSVYAHRILKLRIIDHHRKHNGDHRYRVGRNRPTLVSLDHLRGTEQCS